MIKNLLINGLLMLCSIYNVVSQTSLNVNDIPENLLSDAHIVIRNANKVYELRSNKDDILKIENSITVLNKKGKDALNILIQYQEGNSKIKDLTISYFDHKGVLLRNIKKKEVEDYAISGGSILSDVRYKSFSFEPSHYPITVVYSYELHSKNSLEPNWWPVPSFGTAIEKSSFQIQKEEAIILNELIKNTDDFEIEHSGDYSFNIEGIMAIRKEKYMPSYIDVLPCWFYSQTNFNYQGFRGTSKNWKAYGKWVYDSFLASQFVQYSEADVSNIVGKDLSLLSVKEKIRTIYDYIIEHTRYISVQLSEGGVKPMHPNDVHKWKYGDCKGLSFYAQNLIKGCGIDSDFVFVEADHEDIISLDTSFCSLSQGNHAIAHVDIEGESIWMDLTSTNNPYNFLGTFTDNRQVLLMNQYGGKITKTPRYSHDMNTNIFTIGINLKDDLSIDGSLDCRGIGIPYSQTKYLATLDQETFNVTFFKNNLSSLHNVVFSKTNFEFDPNLVSSLGSYQFTADRFAESAGDYLLIPVSLRLFNIPKLKNSKTRKFEFEWQRDEINKSVTTINIPDGYNLSELPENKNIHTKLVEYTIEYALNNENVIIIRSMLKWNGGIYPREDYQHIKKTFDKIRKSERAFLTLEKK